MIRRFFLAGINGSTPLVESGAWTLSRALMELNLLSPLPLKDCEGLIVVDADKAAIAQAKEAKSNGIPSVLIRNEPAVVCPLNFDESVVKLFTYVVDVGRPDSKFGLFRWPQSWPSMEAMTSLDQADRLDSAVLVNANKLSFIGGELYSLRRKVIDRELVHCYGQGWGSPLKTRLKIALGEFVIFAKARRPPSIKALSGWFRTHPNCGPVVDKLVAMSRYKVAVVIENSPDYMSEKLMDAVFAGCIPVYVGPNVANFGFPNKLVMPAEASVDGLECAIQMALREDYKAWLEIRNSFIHSAEIRDAWDAKNVYYELGFKIRDLLDACSPETS